MKSPTTALITGASGGLGLEFARLFARDGHSLILVARRLDRLKEAAAELEKAHPGIKVTVIDADLAKIGAGKDLFDRVRSLGLSVDYLVNNAGLGSNGAFQDRPLEQELKMMDLNMRTLVELTHLFLPAMLTRRKGRILNVGSMAGFQPGPYMNVYYATKAFVNSFSEGLSEELKGTGTDVTCTVLTPGATATEFAQTAAAGKNMLFSVLPVASAKNVAAYGYRSMHAGRAVAIDGWLSFFSLQMMRFMPRCAVRKLVARVNR